MNSRTASSVFASVLLVLQLLSAPFSHAGALTATGDDCARMQQQATTVGHADVDCGHMATSAHCKHNGQQQHRSHASCSCPCGHVPALATIRLFVAEPTPSVDAAGLLAVAKFDPPLFELLRPPK
jgi:hypothetical protein